MVFERLCLKHIIQIKKVIGISEIQSDSCTRHHLAEKGKGRGIQIDLLIDRTDRCMTGTKKTIFLTMVTSKGKKRNSCYEQLVSNDVTLKDLFKDD